MDAKRWMGSVSVLALAGAFALLVPNALAQADADPAPLAGPEVVTERPPLLEQGLTMAEPVPGSMRMGQVRQIKSDDLRGLLEQLGSVETDHAIRLRRDQHAAIEAMTREHQRAVRAYRAEHAERYAELRKRAGTASMRRKSRQVPSRPRRRRLSSRRVQRCGGSTRRARRSRTSRPGSSPSWTPTSRPGSPSGSRRSSSSASGPTGSGGTSTNSRPSR